MHALCWGNSWAPVQMFTEGKPVSEVGMCSGLHVGHWVCQAQDQNDPTTITTTPGLEALPESRGLNRGLRRAVLRSTSSSVCFKILTAVRKWC